MKIKAIEPIQADYQNFIISISIVVSDSIISISISISINVSDPIISVYVTAVPAIALLAYCQVSCSRYIMHSPYMQ